MDSSTGSNDGGSETPLDPRKLAPKDRGIGGPTVSMTEPFGIAHAPLPPINRRRRFIRIVWLFMRLLASFTYSYARARLTLGSYSFYSDSTSNRRRARLIRRTALEMGGVIIKVGQFLSTRVDLLPAEFIEELSLLQDEVPAVGFSQIRPVIENLFGARLETIFARFDQQVIAAASLGQAYRATLWGGEPVVVKVKRPQIAEVVEADLASLRFVVRQLNRFHAVRRRVDLPGILREFTETIHEELNYIAEAHNAERVAVNFHGNDRVRVPRVYWSHVREDVLTLEFMPGIKITEYERIEEAGISRSDLAEVLLQCYLQQILVDGFFHADPHPGNVFAAPGPTLVLVDFGMVGRITPKMRDNIRALFIGIVRHDFDAVVRALVRLNFVRPSADLSLVRRTVAWAVETFYEMSFAELRDVDPKLVLEQTQEVFQAEAFQIPTNFAFLSRALGTLLGLCTGLDPDFQFMTVSEPYARGLIREGAATLTWDRLANEAKRFILTAANLPTLTQNTLQGIGDADWVRQDLTNVSRALVRVERMVRGLLYGLLATAFLISAAFLAPKYTALAIIGLVITCLLILRVAVHMLTSRRPQV